MRAAGVSHEDFSLLDAMAWPAVGNAPVDSVLVVEATASRVQLNQLVAHRDVTCVDVQTRYVCQLGRSRAGVVEASVAVRPFVEACLLESSVTTSGCSERARSE